MEDKAQGTLFVQLEGGFRHLQQIRNKYLPVFQFVTKLELPHQLDEIAVIMPLVMVGVAVLMAEDLPQIMLTEQAVAFRQWRAHL